MNKWDNYSSRDDLEEDASYDTWAKIFLPVYSQIDVFKNNFDFDTPIIKSSGKVSRLAISVKEDSKLLNKYKQELKENIPIELDAAFLISGDTDFNIPDMDCHRLDNYSLMPITGTLNNEKGKKGKINDNWAKFICELPNLIENPNTYNGRYKKELVPYCKEIVKCARRSYFYLFNNNIYEYCYDVYFYAVEPQDGELFIRAKKLIDCVLRNNGELTMIDEKKLEEFYWELRRDILLEKYGISYV